jgi:hypothetical protein
VNPLAPPTLKASMLFARGEGCAVIFDDDEIYYIGGTGTTLDT